GPGMLMRPEPLVAAIEHVAAAERPRRILLSPRGVPFSDERARALACEGALLLICPRYEGVDERVTAYVDEELSIGDYVLTGGEMAALVVMDAVVGLLPRTYDVRAFHVATPVPTLRRLVERIMRHWDTGPGAAYNHTRKEALALARLSTDLDAVIADIEREAGVLPRLIATTAREGG